VPVEPEKASTASPPGIPDVDAPAGSAEPQAAADAAPAGGAEPSAAELLVREGDIAGDYLEQLLDIIDVDGDIDLDVEGERASVAIVGDHLGALIGPRGITLDALQELTRLAVLNQTGSRSRLMLDVGGYRATRRLELVAVAKNAADRVLADGDSVALEAMNPFERKVVHDAVAARPGVRSESEGDEPDRHVLVLPA